MNSCCQYKNNVYLCIARGEKSLGQECVSCFIPNKEIANFQSRGMRTMQRSFCLYITTVQFALYSTRYIRQRGVFVSQFISARCLAIPLIR